MSAAAVRTEPLLRRCRSSVPVAHSAGCRYRAGVRRAARSYPLTLVVRGLDVFEQRSPLRRFRSDIVSQALWRQIMRLGAKPGEFGADVVTLKDFLDLLAEPIDHRRRRTARREQSVPGDHVET